MNQRREHRNVIWAVAACHFLPGSDPAERVRQHSNRASYRLIAALVDSGRDRGISLPVWDVLTSQTPAVGDLVC